MKNSKAQQDDEAHKRKIFQYLLDNPTFLQKAGLGAGDIDNKQFCKKYFKDAVEKIKPRNLTRNVIQAAVWLIATAAVIMLSMQEMKVMNQEQTKLKPTNSQDDNDPDGTAFWPIHANLLGAFGTGQP